MISHSNSLLPILKYTVATATMASFILMAPDPVVARSRAALDEGVGPIQTCFYSMVGSNDNQVTGTFTNTCDYPVVLFRCERKANACVKLLWARAEPNTSYYFGDFWRFEDDRPLPLEACKLPMMPGFFPGEPLALCFRSPPATPSSQIYLQPFYGTPSKRGAQ